jgi:hypothetical protein
MKILKEFFDWRHEIETTESIKKWFIDNNIDFPVNIPNIKTKYEFSPTILYYSKKDDEVLQLVKNIPGHYIANVTIYSDIFDNYDGVELGIGVSRIENDKYYTEINDYLYSLSEKNIKSLYSRYKANKFNL